MAAFCVVKHVNIVKHICPSFFSSCVGSAFDSFTLEQLEETLCNSVVVAVAASTHALLQIVGFAEILSVIAAELATLIGMHHHRFRRLATQHRHQ